jgi:hypothetical protein
MFLVLQNPESRASLASSALVKIGYGGVFNHLSFDQSLSYQPLKLYVSTILRQSRGNQTRKTTSMDDEVQPGSSKSLPIQITSTHYSRPCSQQRRKMVYGQCPSHLLTRLIEWAESEYQSDQIGDEEEDGVLFDDRMCLWSGRGQLFGRVEEEVYGGGSFNDDMEPEWSIL